MNDREFEQIISDVLAEGNETEQPIRVIGESNSKKRKASEELNLSTNKRQLTSNFFSTNSTIITGMPPIQVIPSSPQPIFESQLNIPMTNPVKRGRKKEIPTDIDIISWPPSEEKVRNAFENNNGDLYIDWKYAKKLEVIKNNQFKFYGLATIDKLVYKDICIFIQVINLEKFLSRIKSLGNPEKQVSPSPITNWPPTEEEARKAWEENGKCLHINWKYLDSVKKSIKRHQYPECGVVTIDSALYQGLCIVIEIKNLDKFLTNIKSLGEKSDPESEVSLPSITNWPPSEEEVREACESNNGCMYVDWQYAEKFRKLNKRRYDYYGLTTIDTFTNPGLFVCLQIKNRSVFMRWINSGFSTLSSTETSTVTPAEQATFETTQVSKGYENNMYLPPSFAFFSCTNNESTVDQSAADPDEIHVSLYDLEVRDNKNRI